VEDPQVLSAEVLAEQWRTRHYLMRRCLGCRRYLGLPVPELADVKGDEEVERQKEDERGTR
jgi:hypothetical protein